LFGHKWIFDWNVVAMLDPDYEQYLYNTKEHYQEILEKAAISLDLVVDPVTPDIENPSADDLNTHVRQLHNDVRPVWNHEYDDEELDVLREMGGNKNRRQENEDEFVNPFIRSQEAAFPDRMKKEPKQNEFPVSRLSNGSLRKSTISVVLSIPVIKSLIFSRSYV